jgi:DNA mismatch repair protein MutS2
MDEKSLHILEFHKVLDRLAGYTSFSAGEELARHLRPTTDVIEARRWQAETREARHLLDTRSDVTVGGARDVRRPVDNAQRGFVLRPEELLEIRGTIVAGRNLRRQLERGQEHYPNLYAISQLIEDCPGIVSAITSTLDERGEVLDSASVRLANIRKELRVVYGRIQDKLQSILNSELNHWLQEPIITMRSGRYVVPLKAEAKGRIRGIVHDQSGSGATLWIEPLNTVDLNNDFRGLQIEEQQEIERILAELSGQVADQGDAIKRIVERLAELDLIFARARYAAVTRAVEPEFVDWRTFAPPRPPRHANERDKWQPPPRNPHPGSTIWLRRARHPLLNPETVVPTDLLVDDQTFLILITGPNTGGKTVSLKTTGLMALMAQAGLHLPALEARLTVFQNVFADIGDEQSIEQSLSTFSAHITNIIRILKRVDDRSLVLIDELGSGTDPAEGAALAQAIVNFLRDKGATTFVATHFPELKVYASQTAGATNASLLFDIETLAPTYEMTIGLPGRSNAFAIARRLGLDETILDEAMKMIGSSSHKAESLLESVYDMRDKVAAQEAATRVALRQQETARDELQRRLTAIETERQEVITEARRQAAEELETIREELRQIRKRLRDTESLNQLKKLQKETEEIEAEQLKPIEPALLEMPKKPRRKRTDLRVGDVVLVKSLNARGEIVELDRKVAEVAVGRLRMRANLEDLELKEREEDGEEMTSTLKLPPAESPGMELDLRGKRVEEGLQMLDRYLDSAIMAHLPWVRIIHGKGTGRMREAVRQSISKNNQIASWEEGRDGEGDAGVTVVKFKED